MNNNYQNKDVQVPSDLMNFLLPDLGDIKEKAFPDISEIQFWRNYNDRILVINDGIGPDFLIYSDLLLQWNKEDRDLEVKDRKPITILLFSYGGDVDVCRSFYNLVLMSKTPVKICNMGICASAAAIIFLSGHERLVMPGSKILIHEGEVGLMGQTTQVIENIDMIKKNEKELEDFILQRSKIDKKAYSKNKKKEWWINAEEAIKLGVADKIIENIDEIYSC